jgi:hypothetical protein
MTALEAAMAIKQIEDGAPAAEQFTLLHKLLPKITYGEAVKMIIALQKR